MSQCSWCGDDVLAGVDNQHKCKPDSGHLGKMISPRSCDTGDCPACIEYQQGVQEQNERIQQNMRDSLNQALDDGDLAAFEEIFEDRDPFEFL